MLVRAIDAVTGSNVGGVTTGTDGSYRLYLRDGTYRVQLGDDGIYSSSKFATEWWNDQPTVDSADTIVVPDAGSATVDAVVEPLRSISGTISWPPGTPPGGCSSATVDVYSTSSSSTVVRRTSVCASNGQARYTVYVEPGEYRIRVTASGYEPGWHGGPTEGDATTIDVTTADAADVDAALGTAGSISGAVTDAAGAPLANVDGPVHMTRSPGTTRAPRIRLVTGRIGSRGWRREATPFGSRIGTARTPLSGSMMLRIGRRRPRSWWLLVRRWLMLMRRWRGRGRSLVW